MDKLERRNLDTEGWESHGVLYADLCIAASPILMEPLRDAMNVAQGVDLASLWFDDEEDHVPHGPKMPNVSTAKKSHAATVVPEPSPAREKCTSLEHHVWYSKGVAKRFTVSRVLRKGEPDDGSFDRQFWKRLGHEAILAAAWDMVEEARTMREQSGSEPRLQRTVCRVIRREG